MKSIFKITAALHEDLPGRTPQNDTHRTVSISSEIEAHDMCQAIEMFKTNCWYKTEMPDELSIRRLPCSQTSS